MTADDAFEMDIQSDIDPGQTLIVGLSNLGLGGLTAVDHLVKHLESDEVGHVRPEVLPAITPFTDGIPRHHTRLYNLKNEDFIVLVGELFVPVPAARSFTDALSKWIMAQSMDEVAVLHGVPYPHSHEQHETFYVATEEYRNKRLSETSLQPLQGGYLDGIAGELVTRSLDDQAPPVGAYVTPTHPPGPDIDAAFRFLDTLETVYDVSVNRAELEELSEEIKRYYSELAQRMAALEERDRTGSRDFPEDRMYM